jgi:hypothetical protein
MKTHTRAAIVGSVLALIVAGCSERAKLPTDTDSAGLDRASASASLFDRRRAPGAAWEFPASRVLPSPSPAVSLVVNGSFEINSGHGTPILPGWAVWNQPGGADGSWYAQTGSGSPLYNFPVPPPPHLNWAAMTDQSGASAHILYQDVTIPAGGAELRFDRFLNNQAGNFFTPPTLDFNAAPNQQFRVDILDPAFPVNHVGPGVLMMVYRTEPGSPLLRPYETITVSLDAFAGQTVRVRFAQVQTAFFFTVGIDNVQVIPHGAPPFVPVDVHTVFSGPPNREPNQISLQDPDVFVQILDVQQYLGRPASASAVRIGPSWETGTPAEAFAILDINNDGTQDIQLRFSTQQLIDNGHLGANTTQLVVWGRDATTDDLYRGSAPVTVLPPDLQAMTISAGGAHTCGLTAAGHAYCWGINSMGQLGDGTNLERLTPTAVAGGLRFVRIATGDSHTCALTADGEAYCWGNNNRGRLGDATTINRNVPTPVVGGLRFVTLAVGTVNTCATTANHTPYCWGWNERGQLGDGTTIDRSVPTPIAGEFRFVQVVPSLTHGCGIDGMDLVFCWGGNDSGQLGDGTNVPRLAPSLPVVGYHRFGALDLGRSHSCAVTTTQLVYCWGLNDWGQLGDGTTENRSVPTPVAGILRFAGISANGIHTCGRATDDQGYCWGDGRNGRLGDGTLEIRLVPTPIAGNFSWAQVSAGLNHSCGLTTAGGAYCWGNNASGQLGDGTLESRLVPTPVLGWGGLATLPQPPAAAAWRALQWY